MMIPTLHPRFLLSSHLPLADERWLISTYPSTFKMERANAMNKTTQSLWTRKINLNATPAPTPPVTPPIAPSTAEKPEVQTLQDDTGETKSTKRKNRIVEESSKRAKIHSSSGGTIAKVYTPPTTRLSDLGGVEACVEKMLEMVAMPLCHPEIYLQTGVPPPRGVLLHGPPGCGKTLLANAMAGELGVPFISISAPSVISGMSGESEKTLRETFEEAKRVAPCLLFIDEIDAIMPKRESAQREMERRIVAQFLTCMDDLSWDKNEGKPVIVMGATNRPDSLDAALRRAGRFDHEISMGVPDEEARARILEVLCSKLKLEGNFDLKALAKATPGYVGADLSALTSAAGIIAVKRMFKQLADGTLVLPPPVETTVADMAIDAPPSIDTVVTSDSLVPAPTPFNFSVELPQGSIAQFLVAHPNPLTDSQLSMLFITSADFHAALSEVQPSSKREGFTTVPDVTWEDIGALYATRDELKMSIVEPIKRPELFSSVGIEAACGVLMWGPPGCGKTLLAKAVANESRANFISVKGPELLNKYVGESERAVRQVFTRARASSPCVIFFDELDALVPRRDESQSEAASRVVNTLLTELDGLEARKAVFVIGATNRPDMIDPAMVRPGRLDKLLYVDLPTAEERVEIMRTMVKRRKVPMKDAETEVAVEVLARDKCDGYSGADLAALIREAGVFALRKTLSQLDSGTMNTAVDGGESVVVSQDDFEAALAKVTPSVNAAQRQDYENLKNKFAGMPVGGGRTKEKRKAGGPGA